MGGREYCYPTRNYERKQLRTFITSRKTAAGTDCVSYIAAVVTMTNQNACHARAHDCDMLREAEAARLRQQGFHRAQSTTRVSSGHMRTSLLVRVKTSLGLGRISLGSEPDHVFRVLLPVVVGSIHASGCRRAHGATSVPPPSPQSPQSVTLQSGYLIGVAPRVVLIKVQTIYTQICQELPDVLPTVFARCTAYIGH